MELDFRPFRVDLVSKMLGFVLSNGPDAKSTDLTTRVRLVQKRGYVFAYGDLNRYEEVDLFTLGLWFSEKRDSGGCWWGRCGDLPPILGFPTRKML